MRNRPTFATSFAAFSEARPDLTQLAGKLSMKMDNSSYVSTPSRPYARSHQKGVRPRGVRQQGFASAHLFGAVCPERGEGVALVLPEISTAAMQVFLAELSRAVPAGTHAALVLDGAGWHVSDDLTVPANLTLIHPPPYSPELNPVERVWEYLRDRWLSHRVLAGGHEAVVDAACATWNALLAEPGRLRSLTNFPRLPPAVSIP